MLLSRHTICVPDGSVLASDVRTGTNICPDSVKVRVENHSKNPAAPQAGFRDDIVVERYEVHYFRSDGRGVEGVDIPYSISGNLASEIQGEADATINIVSKGVASNSTKKGWFTRVWDKVAPF